MPEAYASFELASHHGAASALARFHSLRNAWSFQATLPVVGEATGTEVRADHGRILRPAHLETRPSKRPSRGNLTESPIGLPLEQLEQHRNRLQCLAVGLEVGAGIETGRPPLGILLRTQLPPAGQRRDLLRLGDSRHLDQHHGPPVSQSPVTATSITRFARFSAARLPYSRAQNDVKRPGLSGGSSAWNYTSGTRRIEPCRNRASRCRTPRSGATHVSCGKGRRGSCLRPRPRAKAMGS